MWPPTSLHKVLDLSTREKSTLAGHSRKEIQVFLTLAHFDSPSDFSLLQWPSCVLIEPSFAESKPLQCFWFAELKEKLQVEIWLKTVVGGGPSYSHDDEAGKFAQSVHDCRCSLDWGLILLELSCVPLRTDHRYQQLTFKKEFL